eukprot:TRINITY_DN62904_c0_g2_i1.p1 TRINITY_DN62904_c0_g2~~TRINITY_DN62904_c0_g2_i1.p1  ORF type:complete len:228 (+),score=58.13 TRINITY_DN62904_c0_g2_i1:70-684(+)
MLRSLVGSEMCIRDRYQRRVREIMSAMRSAVGRKTLFFDINETTLNLEPAQRVVDELGGHGAGQSWFDRLVQMSMVCSHTKQYDGFGPLASSAFGAVCQSRGVEVKEEEWARVKAELDVLQPHEDVVPGLDVLAAQGWRLVAFSNSPLASLTAQLQQAQLYNRYDAVLSVDGARAFKPALVCYEYALSECGVCLLYTSPSPRDS